MIERYENNKGLFVEFETTGNTDERCIIYRFGKVGFEPSDTIFLTESEKKLLEMSITNLGEVYKLNSEYTPISTASTELTDWLLK